MSYRLIARFADDMARELDENDHKRGWASMSVRRLLVRAEQELNELRRAIEANKPFKVVRSEAADVGNFLAMLVWNACEDHRQAEELTTVEPLVDRDAVLRHSCMYSWTFTRPRSPLAVRQDIHPRAPEPVPFSALDDTHRSTAVVAKADHRWHHPTVSEAAQATATRTDDTAAPFREWRTEMNRCERRFSEGCAGMVNTGYGDAHQCHRAYGHTGMCICVCGRNDITDAPGGRAATVADVKPFATGAELDGGVHPVELHGVYDLRGYVALTRGALLRLLATARAGLWWEAETRRVLQAVIAEQDSQLTERVCRLALNLRPANEARAPGDDHTRSTRSGLGPKGGAE